MDIYNEETLIIKVDELKKKIANIDKTLNELPDERDLN